jgi:hypothetical protein
MVHQKHKLEINRLRDNKYRCIRIKQLNIISKYREIHIDYK